VLGVKHHVQHFPAGIGPQKDCLPGNLRLRFTGNDMPNQRSKNKAYLGGYIDRALHAEIMRLAKEAGMERNKFGFVVELIREALAQRKKRLVSSR